MSETGKRGVAHPHDLLVRNVLADTGLAADFLRNYLDPELVSTLELGSLKRDAGDTISPSLSKLDVEILYSRAGKNSGEH